MINHINSDNLVNETNPSEAFSDREKEFEDKEGLDFAEEIGGKWFFFHIEGN